MATGMDRSKFRNPDMPVGYVKKKAELKYKEGEEINGEHYIVALYIWNTHMYERDDYATLSDFNLSDLDETTLEDTEPCAVSPSYVKKEKERTVRIKKEPDEKKGCDSKYASALDDASLSRKDNDFEKHKKKKKLKKVKKERQEDDYMSDYSSSLSSYKRLQRYSPSPSPPPPPPEYYPDVNIKEEPFDELHLHGSYQCYICNITMNSLLSYNTHVNGKRHRKNLKVKNVTEVATQSIPPTAVSEDQTRYPKPRPGIVRKKIQSLAKIQHIIENEVKAPCPGLSYVTEIRCIEGTQYYCSMCDSVCSSNSIIPHLAGFKHQLKSVKQFKPGAYDQMSYEPKYKIEKEILSILRAVQKRDGIGRMAVEVEELAPTSQEVMSSGSQPSTSFGYRSESSTSWDYRSEPSTSWDYRNDSRDLRNKLNTSRGYRSQPSTSRETSKEHSDMSFPELYNKATIPDVSASDFHCKVCDSHMNSLQMWESHIRGKRHLTNLKKMPGDRPSKIKTIPMPNRRAFILDRLKEECPDEPIVGLKEIRETEIRETRSHSYQCFLCGSCHTSLDIIDHLISLKHRSKYLDHIDYPGREVISGMSDSAAMSLVRDMCAQVEEDEGQGKPSVHMSKSSMY